MKKVAGNLTIINKEETPRTVKYLCECSCGNNISLTAGQLRKVKVRSCGCIPNGLLDKRGEKFNMLTVKDYHSCKNESHKWECVCDCGNSTIASTSDLSSGHTKSCGCIKKLPEGEAAFNVHYRTYKKGAVTRRYDFNLTKEEFKQITSQNCHYCGEPPKYKESKEFLSCNGNVKINGIDRVVNSLGYTSDNCVPCCDSCNFLKGSMNYDDFINLCKKITKNLNSGS